MEKKTNLGCRTAIAASVFAASMAGAENSKWFNLTANDDNPAPVNRFGLSYRAGFNVSAKFRNVGGLSQVNDPGPVASQANHNYDDGYNRVDSAGNNHGGTLGTWNWGYQNASQVNGTTEIFMHSTSSVGEATTGADADTQMGVELTYHRQFGRIGKVLWGIEAAFNYSNLSIKDSDPQSHSVSLITDRYGLEGVTAPEPPYDGSFQGPGPIIDDLPTRTVGPGTAGGVRELSANLYGFRIGPYFEFPVAKRLSVSTGVGLALAFVQSDFRFDETVLPTAGAAVLRSAKASHDELLPGLYVTANLSYQINKSWNAFVGAQYSYLGNFNQTLSDKEVRIDLGKSIALTAGVGFSF
jgi:hypothetical protein